MKEGEAVKALLKGKLCKSSRIGACLSINMQQIKLLEIILDGAQNSC